MSERSPACRSPRISLQRFRPFGSRLALAIALWSCAPAAWADDAGRALYHGHVEIRRPHGSPAWSGQPSPTSDAMGTTPLAAARAAHAFHQSTARHSPRRHQSPAYDAMSFWTAVSQGRASDERTLSLAMPRFDLSPSQSNSLWEYLTHIAEEDRSGVSADQIRIVVPALTGNLADAERLRDRRPPTDTHAIPRSR